MRVLTAGKAKKVAFAAYTPKLLTMLNSMARTGEGRDPTTNMFSHVRGLLTSGQSTPMACFLPALGTCAKS